MLFCLQSSLSKRNGIDQIEHKAELQRKRWKGFRPEEAIKIKGFNGSKHSEWKEIKKAVQADTPDKEIKIVGKKS